MKIRRVSRTIPFAVAKGEGHSRKKLLTAALLAGSSVFIVNGGHAQTASSSNPPTQVAAAGDAGVIEEVVVTARRREESIQEVPLVVTALSSQQLNQFNIKNMDDITSLVPGLSLGPNANGIGALATLRGINFDVNASGNAGTVQFYLNDEPITANAVLQSMYDIGDIEVLHGPQGTLRGKASPSGSITVTSKLPDMDDWGGYFDNTDANHNADNVNLAVNIPIIPGKLAIRLAGLYDYNEANEVHSINDPNVNPYARTTSERATIRFTPNDDIDIIGTIQNFDETSILFDQVESADLADSTQPASPVAISPSQRLSVENTPRDNHFYFEDYNVRAEWRFLGQKLNYVGAWSHEEWYAFAPNDIGDFFGSAYAGNATAANNPYATGFATNENFKNAGQFTVTTALNQTNEVRLSSDERLFGMVDYVAGILIHSESTPVYLWAQTPVFLGPPSPATASLYTNANINQTAGTLERSAYGNIDVHIDDATEISAGARYINYHSHNQFTEEVGLAGSGVIVTPLQDLGPAHKQDFGPIIYKASISHNFSDDIMAYVSTGSSWRPNAETNQIIDMKDAYPWGTEEGLFNLAPEKSTSYEIGAKSTWFNKTLLADVTFYHQDFTNYFFSSPNVVVAARTGPNPFVGNLNGPNPTDSYSIVTIAPAEAVDVPATVNGVEGEFNWQPLAHWGVGATFSYSAGVINNGSIPCNTAASEQALNGTITAPQFVTANGGQQVATCKVNYRAGTSPPFSASVQSEYSHTLTEKFDGFIRGLAIFNSEAPNDVNPISAVSAYALFNLYGGLRDPDGMWDITLYGKNIFDAQRVLTRGMNPASTSVQNLAVGIQELTTYRSIMMTAPQEFGINLHIKLGSG